MKHCQRIFWCLAFLIFWQSFKSIGSIEQSIEPQKSINLCFAKNLIEIYNMSVVVFFNCQPGLKMFTKLYFFNLNHNFRVRNQKFL